LRPLVHDEVRPFEERGIGEDRGGQAEDKSARSEPAWDGVPPFVGQPPRQRARGDTERVRAHRKGGFLQARGEVRPRLRLSEGRFKGVEQLPRRRTLRGQPPGISLRRQYGDLPRADDPAQHRVDESRRAAAADGLDRRHRFVQRRPVGDPGVEELVPSHAEGVPDVRIGLFEGAGEERKEGEIDRPASAERPHHQLGQQPAVPGVGEPRLPERAVEHDIGEGVVPVHPGQYRDRRGPYDSRSPIATRRPWAYAHASIAFPPSGCTIARRRTPSPQATAIPSRPTATISPGSPALPDSRATADARPFSPFPPCAAVAVGHGVIPRTRLRPSPARRLQSILPCSFFNIGAYVARAGSCGVSTSVPSRSLRNASPSASAPRTESFENIVSAVSSSPIGISRTCSMGPVSIPSSIRMMVIPVVVSPRTSAQLIGAAPRYFGRSDAWTLMHPRRGMSRIDFGRMWPYATTTTRSGASAAMRATASGRRAFSGW